MTFTGFVLAVALLIANWFIFKKAGCEGWEGIIPIYNLYVKFELLYGNGFRCLTLLIPLYNIYVIIKFNIDWARAFNKSTGFGLGLTFLPNIFTLILAFGDAVFKDGSYANTSEDFVVRTVDTVKNAANAVGKDEHAAEKLVELKKLFDDGIINEEEYNAKKAELLKRL